QFVFLATYDPEEGEVQASMKDRVGLSVVATALSADETVEVIRRGDLFERDAISLVRGYAAETARISEVIARARSRLRRVRISADDLRRIANMAMKLGVEGNRADVFAARAARASAALSGSDQVTEEDLAAAVRLVLIPRSTVLQREETTGQS